jgi:hypothetical protein
MAEEDKSSERGVNSSTLTISQAESDQLYTIFDKRQKIIIVFVVSTAATCKSTSDPSQKENGYT